MTGDSNSNTLHCSITYTLNNNDVSINNIGTLLFQIYSQKDPKTLNYMPQSNKILLHNAMNIEYQSND